MGEFPEIRDKRTDDVMTSALVPIVNVDSKTSVVIPVTQHSSLQKAPFLCDFSNSIQDHVVVNDCIVNRKYHELRIRSGYFVAVIFVVVVVVVVVVFVVVVVVVGCLDASNYYH